MRLPRPAWPLAVGLALAPATAHAQEASTGLVLGLLVIVGAAYLVADLLIDRIQRRFLVLSGFEYILLGLALGPAVPAFDVFQDVDALLPIIALAVGWIGLLRGMELDLGQLRDAPPHRTRLALLVSVGAGSLVGMAAYAFLVWGGLGPVSPREAGMTAAMLGCVAASGSIGPLEVVAQRYTVSGGTSELLRRATRLGDAAALFVFGVLFCVFRTGDGATGGADLRPAEWALVSVALGVTLGLLFRVFLADDDSDNGRFLALVGIITFASGAAYLLQLSPLLVTLVLGAVQVNSATSGAQVRQTLERTERPMSLVLRLFAGALVPPAAVVPALVGILAFVALRYLGKAGGSIGAAWGRPLRADMYRGMLGHGDVTVAMAISFRLVYSGPGADVAYVVAMGSVVISDLLAPRALRSLLVDLGEIRREREA